MNEWHIQYTSKWQRENEVLLTRYLVVCSLYTAFLAEDSTSDESSMKPYVGRQSEQ